MHGSEWDEYFRRQYGDKNVHWDTKIKSTDDIFKNPEIIKDITPDKLADLFRRDGWEVEALGRGSKAGIPFSEGGGMSIRKMGEGGEYIDKYIQYHPGGGHHGDSPYYKISSGSTGAQRLPLGEEVLQ